MTTRELDAPVTDALGGASTTLIMPSWMRQTALADVWTRAYIETGNAELAMQQVRISPEYDTYFAGNRRDDGSLRYSEATYLSLIESYEDTLLSVNVNPDLFRGQFDELVAGLVSPTEFTTRVESMYENIIESSPAIRDFYAQNYGIDMSDSAIIASFLDPDIGQAVLDKRITISQIGGEASTRGLDVTRQYAESLQRAGLGRGEAQQFFGEAVNLIPALSVLAARNADPDDDFDLQEFTAAQIFDDPVQRRRMRRLVAQESALFTGGGRASIVTDRDGGVSGLEVL